MFKLCKGSKVGIVSPAGHINGEDDIQLSLDYLESLGLICILGKSVYNNHFYMAGSDAERTADLMNFYKDTEIKAIFTTAGGCGCQRLLNLLDYEIIQRNPKPIFGLSDNTALQMGIYAKTQVPSVTGFSLKYDFKAGHIDGLVDSSLKAIICGKKQIIASGETLIGGKAHGTLIGGCLSLIRSICGTPFFPDLTSKILLIEDVGEKTYKLDLMLTQLRQQPNFDKINGIVFGIFKNCEEADDGDGSTDDILNNFATFTQVPIIKNFAYGHIPSRYVLPTGVTVKIDANQCILEYV